MEERLRRGLDWTAPAGWRRIEAIDAHAAGEPLRVILSGVPTPPGGTIIERRRAARAEADRMRTALMWEPRGHADMYGCLVTPPERPGSDFGVLFLHNEGYSTMCGHGIIAVTTVAVETGIIPARSPETPVAIDTPAGLVTAVARIDRGRVESVRFRNVPSFVLALDESIDVPGFGRIRYDLAFGGAFYAYVPAADFGLRGTPNEFRALIEAGTAVKRAVTSARSIEHPFEPELGFLYGTIFVAPPIGAGADSRNVCVFADGEVDRSPTGTGVSGRIALHFARGEIGLGAPIVIESLIGTRFTGRAVEETTFGPHRAVVPEVEGTAHITGRHTFLIDPDDPLADGFLLR